MPERGAPINHHPPAAPQLPHIAASPLPGSRWVRGRPCHPPAPSAALLPPYAEPTPAPRGEEKLSSLLHVLL